ncbi:hypothetical protein NCC49_004187 [Naganishia albida]|nr:hypothetical protein NCC49_004187 [Naganishia albida]
MPSFAKKHMDNDNGGLANVFSGEDIEEVLQVAVFASLRIIREAEKSLDIGRDLLEWLRLEVPTLEDGNNFGVDVQEEMIRQVDTMVNAAARFRGLPKGHYDDRMALAMQWNKFPNLKDHAQMRQAARQRAKTILQTELPAYIAHLDDLLEQQSQNPESPLWHGHLESGSFIKKNVKLLLLKEIAKDGMIPSETPHNLDDTQLGGTQASTKGQEDKSISKKSEDDFGGEDNEDTSSDACWKGRLPPNEICDRLADLVHKESNQGVVLARGLLQWLRLEVPTIEDGNNFGVDVQDKILRSLHQFRSSSWEHQVLPKARHYGDRRALAMSWCRYPNLEDHAAAIALGDRHWFYFAHSALDAQRSHALAVLDGLQKNWTRVHDPKDKKGGNGRAAMY